MSCELGVVSWEVGVKNYELRVMRVVQSGNKKRIELRGIANKRYKSATPKKNGAGCNDDA